MVNVLPEGLRTQLERVREYVSDDEIEGLLKRLADRYAVAKARRETGEAMVKAKFHRGAHDEFRWSADEVIRK